MPKKDDLIRNRKKHYCPIPGNTEGEELKIDQTYNAGGINYFTYEKETAGLYVHFSPVKREFKGSMVIESFTAFRQNAFKMMALPQGRFTSKAWLTLEAFLETNLETIRELYFAGEHERLATFLLTRELPELIEQPEQPELVAA